MQSAVERQCLRPTKKDLALLGVVIMCLTLLSACMIPVILPDEPYGVLYEILLCIAVGLYLLAGAFAFCIWGYCTPQASDTLSPPQVHDDTPIVLIVGMQLLVFAGILFTGAAAAVLVVALFV